MIRGFYNTLDILKGEYLSTLKNFNLLERFFSFLVNSFDQPVLSGEDMVSMKLLEQRTDLVRTRVMSSLEMSLQAKVKDRKILIKIGKDVLHT